MKSSLPRPVQELKGFTKLYLYPNEEETFTITLNKESFGFYDEKEHGFVVEPGEFEIRLAFISRYKVEENYKSR